MDHVINLYQQAPPMSSAHAMDCDPPQTLLIQQPQSLLSLTPSSTITQGGSTSVSMNVLNQRYMQHQHRQNRYPAMANMLGGSNQKINLLNYAPASLPIDLHHHSNATSTAVSGAIYAPFAIVNDVSLGSTSFSNHIQSGSKVGGTSNPNSGNASAADRDGESPMVGVCVQQSPVVIH